MAGDFYLIPYIRELGETHIRNLKGFEQGKLLAAIIHMVIFFHRAGQRSVCLLISKLLSF